MALVISGCGGGGNKDGGGDLPNPPTTTYTISGAVSGLTGTGLVLRNNGTNDLAINANGAFQFTTALVNSAAYAITVATQPSAPTQTCVVGNGSGTVGSANVTNIAVTCTGTAFTVGGTVTGLTGSGLVLQNNAGDNLAVASNGAFVFNTALANNSAYNVSVLTHPGAPIQRCSVTSGTGTNAGGNVSNIAVACADVVPRFVWSMNFNAGTVSTFRVDAGTGELRAAGYGKVGTGPIGFRVVPSPTDANVGFVYTLNQVSMDITASSSNRTTNAEGALIAGSPFSVGATPNSFISHPNNRFLYVTHAAAGSISAYAINDTTGALTQISGSPFAAGTLPFNLTFDASGQFAYVVNQGSANIYVYSVNTTTGALTEVVANRVATGGTPQVLLIPPGSRFGYVVNNTSASISVFAINAASGALTPVAGSPFATGTNPNGLGFHPSGRFAYVTNTGAANISAYAIDASTGALSPLGGSPYATGASPGGFVFDATFKFMYVPNRASPSASISAFAVDSATGVLTAVGSPLATGIAPRLIPEASGKYLYATSANDATIYSYRINQTSGALTPFTDTPVVATGLGPIFGFSTLPSTVPISVIPKYAYIVRDAGTGNGNVTSYSVNALTGTLTTLGAPIATQLAPEGLATTPNGKYVYVANTDSSTLSAFESTNGVLTAVAGGPFVTPAAPHFIAIDGGGRFAYAAHDNSISSHAINSATGALTQIGATVAAGNYPETLTVDNSGRCLFAANNGSNTVSAYTINSLTGALTAAVGSPFAAGSFPVAVALHPSGRFVYVTNDGNNTVSAYSTITGLGNTCALTPIVGSPTSAGSAAIGLVSIAAEPNGKYVYAANEVAGTVSIFSVNQTTGTLTLIGTPAAINATGVTADPSGKYLYVVIHSATTENLTTYSINPATGAITQVTGTPVDVTNGTGGAITGELQL
jgi:6-phosphogluconolactonase (cycloisomerase 2 family)